MTRTLAIAVSLVLSLAASASGQWVTGDVYVSSFQDSKIYRVDGALNVTVFADASDGLNGNSALEFSPADTLLVSSYYTQSVLEFDSAGNGSVLHDKSTGLVGPFGENGLAFDSQQNLYVSDFDLQTIWKFPAGGGGPTVFADASDGIGRPDGLAFVSNGDLLVANREGYDVLRIDPSGNTTVFDPLTETPFTIVVRSNGDVYLATDNYGAVYRYPGGDASQRYLLASVVNTLGIPSLQIGADDQTLYYTSYGMGNLVTIDADSGAMNEVIPPNTMPGPISIAVYRPRFPASWSNYGAGFPGTGGVPAFTATQPPVLGTRTTLDLDNSLGQPTVGLIFVGFARADLHSSWGGDLLVDPTLVVPISFSYGLDSFDWDVPNDPALIALTIDLQALEADGGAAKGVSFTAGLELVPGY
jgi:SMP-30/gluconolaconase/LRE-like protein